MTNMDAKIYIEPMKKGESWEEFPVQFNPAQLGIHRTANYTEVEISGHDDPVMQYSSGKAKTMDLDLVFDTYEPPSLANNGVEGGKDVTEITSVLEKTMLISGELHRPPIVKFHWGSILFEGIVTDMKQQFTMFLNDGKPVRAKVTLNLKSVEDFSFSKNKTPKASPDRTKVHTLCQGEYLWYLAWKEYGDVELWREIARANGITDPLEVTPGQEIIIPAL